MAKIKVMVISSMECIHRHWHIYYAKVYDVKIGIYRSKTNILYCNIRLWGCLNNLSRVPSEACTL